MTDLIDAIMEQCADEAADAAEAAYQRVMGDAGQMVQSWGWTTSPLTSYHANPRG